MQLLIEKSNVEVQNGNKSLAVDYLKQASSVRQSVGERNDEAFENALEYALYKDLFEPVL